MRQGGKGRRISQFPAHPSEHAVLRTLSSLCNFIPRSVSARARIFRHFSPDLVWGSAHRDGVLCSPTTSRQILRRAARIAWERSCTWGQ
eukprot:COSAG01_NODE_11437_length_1934_cov_5.403815_2_plen_89_part_00